MQRTRKYASNVSDFTTFPINLLLANIGLLLYISRGSLNWHPSLEDSVMKAMMPSNFVFDLIFFFFYF